MQQSQEEELIVSSFERATWTVVFQGYRDFLLNLAVTLDDGTVHVCELQLHYRKIKLLGMKLRSHECYEFFREYYAGNMSATANALASLYKAQVEVWGRGGKDFTKCEDLVQAALWNDGAGGATLSEEELGNVAKLLRNMGELKLALQVREHVVERVKSRVGSAEGAGVGKALREVASALMYQGKLEDAERAYLEALRRSRAGQELTLNRKGMRQLTETLFARARRCASSLCSWDRDIKGQPRSRGCEDRKDAQSHRPYPPPAGST